jgi:hypothetical protein
MREWTVPRMIAFLTCRIVEPDDARTYTLRGCHTVQLAPSFPTVAAFRAFVAYADAPVNTGYDLGIEARERSTGTSLGYLYAMIHPHVQADICDYTFDMSLSIERPMALSLHLLVEGAEIGSTYYTILPLTPPE